VLQRLGPRQVEQRRVWAVRSDVQGHVISLPRSGGPGPGTRWAARVVDVIDPRAWPRTRRGPAGLGRHPGVGWLPWSHQQVSRSGQRS
jgi:hypothetical protein